MAIVAASSAKVTVVSTPQPKRSYGTGALLIRRDAHGRETWYGQWRADGRLHKRKLGLKRPTGTREGLTKAMAEKELRRILDAGVEPAPTDRLSVGEAGARYLAHLRTLGRKPSTLGEYESMLRVHLGPGFTETPLTAVTPARVERYVRDRLRAGSSPKTVRNQLGLLHSVFRFGQKRGWCTANPTSQVDRPRDLPTDADIRFLDGDELQALLARVPSDALGAVEAPLYLTAAMTGLRQGELLALRWHDVDWVAGRLRVRRAWVRGEYGTPKSKRSTRSVPLADQVAQALEQRFGSSAYQADDDLVFGHPHLGTPLDRSKLLKRFKAAAQAAGLGSVRFHDLRHTFGTRMASAGVSMRTLQEWMGHRDFKTTLIYADYAPSTQERELVQRAFAPGPSSSRSSQRRSLS